MEDGGGKGAVNEKTEDGRTFELAVWLVIVVGQQQVKRKCIRVDVWWAS